MEETGNGTAIDRVLKALSPGIRALSASDAQRTHAYRTVLAAIADGTRVPEQRDEQMGRLAEMLRLFVERDVHELCELGPSMTLEEWVRFLHRAQFVQKGYASALYPYNHAVCTLKLSQQTTCDMVRAEVHRTLRVYAPLWRASLRATTTDYVQACLTYVHTGSSPGRPTLDTLKALPARTTLAQWYATLRAYQAPDDALVGAKRSMLEAVHHTFTGFTDLASGTALLNRVYEMEVAHCQMMGSIEAPYLKLRCAKRIHRQFGLDFEWHKVQNRLLSTTPLEGEPSLYYDESVLRAFVQRDSQPVYTFGRLLTTEVFRLAKRDSGYVHMYILYRYARASLRLHNRVRGVIIRELWAFLDEVLSGDGPGGVFVTDKFSTHHKMQALERRQLSTDVLSRVAEQRPERAANDEPPHVLLAWLMEMMDPSTLGLAWNKDRVWWLDLLNVAVDCERLLQEYLDESLSVRLVTGEIDVDAEMDLMVCLSLRFHHVPSRALQRFRLLLAPYSIAPEFSEATSVYLAPRTVWEHVPANLCSNDSLHPVVNAPLSATVDTYANEYFPERHVTWSHWYSTATVELERPDTPSYSLTAPVFAVSLVAHVAETLHGCTQQDLVDHVWSPATASSRLTANLYVGFWLRLLVEHRVVTTKVQGSTEMSQWTYRLRTWTGTRTVPVPDVPHWWSEDGYRSCATGAGARGEASSVGPKAMRRTERLLVARELVECKCVHTLKHASAPVTQSELLATLRRAVAPLVAVSNQDVSEMVDALVRKGYLVCDKGGQLSFDTTDEETKIE